MKSYFTLIGLFISIGLLTGFSEVKSKNESIKLVNYEIPDDINTVFSNSCVMCHSNDSKNTKAKLKLNFDEMDKLNKSKMISKLSKIGKVVNKGEMPPEKFTSKYPDKKLSEKDKNALIAWSKDYAEKLSKE